MRREQWSRQNAATLRGVGALATIGSLLAGGSPFSGLSGQDVLPVPQAPLKGLIGLSVKDAERVAHVSPWRGNIG